MDEEEFYLEEFLEIDNKEALEAKKLAEKDIEDEDKRELQRY